MNAEITKPMPLPPSTKGWCPTAYRPMPTGDGLLGRVKPPLGLVSATAAHAIAQAALRYGSGQLELTNRGGIQLRGLSQESATEFAAAIAEAGLASRDAAAERRRNLLLTAFAQASERDVAAAIEHWLEENAALAALPPKFGVAVDSAASPSPSLAADIRCVAQNEGWRIELDGESAAVLTTAPLTALDRLTGAFLALAARLAPAPRRMRALVRAIGGEAILAEAGLTPTLAAPQPRQPAGALVGWTGEASRAFGLGAPFGALDAAALLAAADLAERYGDGLLRTTPWRALLLREVAAGEVPELAAAAALAGFIVEPDDARLAITACPGWPACSSAHAPTRADAEALAAEQPAWLAADVHLSGCTKGCAHPAAAAITLTATAQGYDLIRRGRASDTPVLRGLSLAAASRHLSEDIQAPS